jgi:hypothetical protein
MRKSTSLLPVFLGVLELSKIHIEFHGVKRRRKGTSLGCEATFDIGFLEKSTDVVLQFLRAIYQYSFGEWS